MNVIFFGDVFGKSGRTILLQHLKRLRLQYNADLIIINGENLADGKGLTEKTTKPLLNEGVDAITGGNHLWDRAEAYDYLKNEPRIIKPLNYPEGAWGSKYFLFSTNSERLLILCLTGQLFMPTCDSPFLTMEKFLLTNPYPEVPILVDFHAESTAEKRAFGMMYDGCISAVVGTHTHIQTADEEILPNGTGYITDVGMTGPHDSVIGIKKQLIIEKIKTGMPHRYEVSDSGLQINAVFLKIDNQNKKTIQINRIRELF